MLDGEDYGDFYRDEGVFLGSRYLSRHYHDFCKPTYGILLVAPDAPNASKFRIQTAAGVKALMKLP